MLQIRPFVLSVLLTALLPFTAQANLIRFQATAHFTDIGPLPDLAVGDPVVVTLLYDSNQSDRNRDGDPANGAYDYDLTEFQISLPSVNRSYRWQGGLAAVVNDFNPPGVTPDYYVFAITNPAPPIVLGDYFSFEVAFNLLSDSLASITSNLLPDSDIDLSLFSRQRVLMLRMSNSQDGLACLGDTCNGVAEIDRVSIGQAVSEPGVLALLGVGLFLAGGRRRLSREPIST